MRSNIERCFPKCVSNGKVTGKMFLEIPDFRPSSPWNLTGPIWAGFLRTLVRQGSGTDLTVSPEIGLLCGVFLCLQLPRQVSVICDNRHYAPVFLIARVSMLQQPKHRDENYLAVCALNLDGRFQ